MAFQLTDNAFDRKRAETDTSFGIESVNCFDEGQRADLNEVVVWFTPIGEAPSKLMRQSKVRRDDLVAQARIFGSLKFAEPVDLVVVGGRRLFGHAWSEPRRFCSQATCSPSTCSRPCSSTKAARSCLENASARLALKSSEDPMTASADPISRIIELTCDSHRAVSAFEYEVHTVVPFDRPVRDAELVDGQPEVLDLVDVESSRAPRQWRL